MMTFQLNGVHLSAADFPQTLQGRIAFQIAFAAATKCRDKDAALKMLLSDAAEIILKVKEGSVP